MGMIKPSLPTLPTLPTYLTYLTYHTYHTYLTYLTSLQFCLKHRAKDYVFDCREGGGGFMDPITMKTPNPKCRCYWCLIEYIDWRYS